jgi:hypothetical protein
LLMMKRLLKSRRRKKSERLRIRESVKLKNSCSKNYWKRNGKD